MPENSLLSKGYWHSAAAEFKSLRTLTFAAVMVAIGVVLSSFYIPVAGDYLRIKFTYIPSAIGALICGPLVGITIGAATDLLGVALFPSGAFFPGYTLSAVLAGFIYGLFLYRRQITVLRLLLAKLTVNYFINAGLGSLWNSIVRGKGYMYYFTTSIIKNSILLPIEVLILVLLLKALLQTMTSRDLIPRQDKLKWI